MGQKIVVTATDAQVNPGSVAEVFAIDTRSANPHRIQIGQFGWRTWVRADQIEHENVIDALGGLLEPAP